MTAALDVLLRAVETGAMPGGVVVVRRGGKTLLHEPFGTLDGHEPVATDTLYDLASLTKPLATAASLLKLLQAGEILLGTPAAELLGLPEEALKDITVRHLLTHTSGLPAWAACYTNGDGPVGAVEKILSVDRVEPEQRYEYSCLNYILLAKILHNITGKSLDILSRQQVFVPLGLSSLTFAPDPLRCAPTVSREGSESLPILLKGTVHDGNARAIARGGDFSGNAGLFGTATDVATFGEAVRTGEGGIFSAPLRARMMAPQSEPSGHTLCFFCAPNPFTPSGELLSERAVGHSGYTGTLLLLDPDCDLTVVLLTNAVFVDGKESFLRWRRKFLNAVAGAIC